jgi:hypothetical protein
VHRYINSVCLVSLLLYRTEVWYRLKIHRLLLFFLTLAIKIRNHIYANLQRKGHFAVWFVT